MVALTNESKIKLQNILSKRIDRPLSDTELEEAYKGLMDFAFALIELYPVKTVIESKKSNFEKSSKLPIAFHT